MGSKDPKHPQKNTNVCTVRRGFEKGPVPVRVKHRLVTKGGSNVEGGELAADEADEKRMGTRRVRTAPLTRKGRGGWKKKGRSNNNGERKKIRRGSCSTPRPDTTNGEKYLSLRAFSRGGNYQKKHQRDRDQSPLEQRGTAGGSERPIRDRKNAFLPSERGKGDRD